MFIQNLECTVILLIHDPTNFAVNLGRNIFGEVACVSETLADEDFLLACQINRSDNIAHAVFRDDLTCDFRCPHEVILCTCADVAEEERLCGTAAEINGDHVKQLVLCNVFICVGGQHSGVACSTAARYDRNLMHGLAVRGAVCNDRMTDFVISDNAHILIGNNAALFFGSVKNAFDSLVNIGGRNRLFVFPYGKDGGFIQHIFKIRTGAAGSQLCDFSKVNVRFKGLVLSVNRKDLLSALNVRIVDRDASVKPAGTEQRRIKNIGTVGRRNNDDSLAVGKTIHFNKKLV